MSIRQPLSEEGVRRREQMLDELRPIVRRRPRVARARAGATAGVFAAIALGVFWQLSSPQGIGPGSTGQTEPRQVADARIPEPQATKPERTGDTTTNAVEEAPSESRRSSIVIVRSDPSVIGRVKIAGREPTLTRIIGDDDLARELGPRGIGVVRTADGVFLTADPTENPERPGRSRLDHQGPTETIE